MALSNLKIPPHKVALVFGIGCSGNFGNFVKGYVFHSLHGRALPVAAGAKLANSELTVIAIGGDGDGFAEGLSHTIHTIRSNVNITYIVHDNHVYSLTTGQTSPTSLPGFKTKTTPEGSFEYPINPMALAISAGSSFAARGFAGDIPHLANLIKKGIEHKGFSFIDVMQPCPSFNKELTYDWYRERVYKIEDQGYVPDNRFKAWAIAQEKISEKIATGIIYRDSRPTLESNFAQLNNNPLVKQTEKDIDLKELLKQFK